MITVATAAGPLCPASGESGAGLDGFSRIAVALARVQLASVSTRTLFPATQPLKVVREETVMLAFGAMIRLRDTKMCESIASSRHR